MTSIKSKLEDLVQFKTLINPQKYESIAIIMLVIGFFMMTYFFMYI